MRVRKLYARAETVCALSYELKTDDVGSATLLSHTTGILLCTVAHGKTSSRFPVVRSSTIRTVCKNIKENNFHSIEDFLNNILFYYKILCS